VRNIDVITDKASQKSLTARMKLQNGRATFYPPRVNFAFIRGASTPTAPAPPDTINALQMKVELTEGPSPFVANCCRDKHPQRTPWKDALKRHDCLSGRARH